MDQSGTLASVKRHDYLPFGEEIGGPQVALLGGRTTAQGYTGDATRQKFTGYEADAETGLNFAQARYQSSLQGRFTSVDPLGASASVGDPQSFNRYSYVNNNPTNLTDPSGMMTPNPASGMVQTDDEYSARTLQASSDAKFKQDVKDHPAPQHPKFPKPSHITATPILLPDPAPGEQTPSDIGPAPGFDAALGDPPEMPSSPLADGVKIAQDKIPGCTAVFQRGTGATFFNNIVTGGGIVTNGDTPVFNPRTMKSERLADHTDLYGVFYRGQIVINPSGPFFDGRWKNDEFNRGLSEAEAYAVFLMHENAHGTGDFPPDIHSGYQSGFNSLRVRIQCLGKPLR